MSVLDINTCRICLLEKGTIHILNKISKNSIQKMIVDFCNINIISRIGTPSSLCDNCVQKVKNAYQLKIQIKLANEKIEQVFLDSKLESLSCSDTDDLFDEVVNNFPEVKLIKTEENCISKSSIDKKSKFKKRQRKSLNKRSGECVENRTCKECGKLFASVNNLLVHSTVHTGIKPYTCDICFKEFTQEANLCTHKKIHSGEKPFICEFCSKQFVKKISLQRHMNTHLPDSEKKFICEICKKSFHEQRLLKRHKIIHEDIKLFVCNDCGNRFNKRSSLNRHYKVVHLMIKNHICSICSKSFSSAANLDTHFRIHTGEKPFECKYCNSKFNQSTPLVRHTQIHITKGDKLKDQ